MGLYTFCGCSMHDLAENGASRPGVDLIEYPVQLNNPELHY